MQGCRNDGRGKSINVQHGHCRYGMQTPEYKAWDKMIDRCMNENNTRYPSYGGRGITVCLRWFKFENFLADVGEKPEPKSEFSLDRINNDGNYEPGNVRWATRSEQASNRRRPAYYDRPARINECGHPERRHCARGMCNSCYVMWRTRGRIPPDMTTTITMSTRRRPYMRYKDSRVKKLRNLVA